ncbi:MAG: VWA domain-containing protein [Euryarchaeota archaeon]|nr:VWA domain-containing protein [Euryarchaeota archaeon]
MWSKILLCIVISAFIFSSAASGLTQNEVTVTSDTDWLVAGNGETALITVQIENASVNVTGVNFNSVDGTFGAVTTEPDATPTYTTIFTETTQQSGVADILVDIAYHSGADETTRHVEKHFSQKIDHNTPYRISNLDYEPEATAGSTVDIIVQMTDQYGNPVDNKRDEPYAEEIKFSCSSNSLFVENGGTSITKQVDEYGNITLNYLVSTSAGTNTVYVDPVPENPGEQYIYIETIGDSVPSNINVNVQPDNGDTPFLPIGADNYFVLTYTLTDQYGNPSLYCPVEVSDDQSGLLGTYTPNQDGIIQLHYGPSETTGFFTVTAAAKNNPQVNCTSTVEFYSSEPTDLVVTANPQVLASRDVNYDLTSEVRAKIIDEKGNPVRDVDVSFQITGFSIEGYTQTQAPELDNGGSPVGVGESITGTSDNDGYATVSFHPGAFTRDSDDINFSSTAKGSATVQAQCTLSGVEKTGNIDINYRNYPYLSVETVVEPETVEVNNTVSVTIRLRGDGWALQPNPIDVCLCTDRSGSMLKNTTKKSGSDKYDYDWVQSESVDDRMVHAMEAGKNFVSQMDPSKDRIGLVSFGKKGSSLNINDYDYHYWLGNDYKYTWFWWSGDSSDDASYLSEHYHNYQTYSSYATRDIEMTCDYTNVSTTIENWLPYGGTPMREGIYRSVRNIVDNPRDAGKDPVLAIILLTDGDWNTGGNPQGASSAFHEGDLASTESVITYAQDNNIRIYTIALGNEPNHDELQSYADETGGEFYSATAGDDLSLIYEDIADELQSIAGVDTSMDACFDNVEVTNVTVPDGKDVFSYEYIDGSSTLLNKFNDTVGTISPYPYTIDQTSDWNADTALYFSQDDIGTIYVNGVWEGTFSLNVSMAGNINIFGGDSVISFNGTDGESTISLPDTYVTAVEDINATGIDYKYLDLFGLTNTSADVDSLHLKWDINYTGTDIATQECWYWNEDGKSAQVRFDVITSGPGPLVDNETTTLPLADLRDGTYRIWVKGMAPDAGVALSNNFYYIFDESTTGTYYIKIE